MSEKIAMLYGSVRRGRLGIRAVDFVRPLIEAQGFEVDVIDAHDVGPEMLHVPFHHYAQGDAPDELTQLAARVENASGYVLVAGEYNHGIQPGLKNLIDHFYDQYAYKPAMIVSYSYGMFGGVRAEAQLRAVLGEVGMSVIPMSLPIPKIADNLGSDGVPTNDRMPEFAAPVIKQFIWYVNALGEARKIGLPD